MYDGSQLRLSFNRSINPISEIKRQIRLVMSESNMSRDEIMDEMNRIGTRDGIKGKVSRATIDGWCKDSDPGRCPSLAWLVVFCAVMETPAPVAAMAGPLGYGIIGAEDGALLKWAKAEMAKKKAIKAARLALEAIDIAV